jgi:hypothetical protein
MKIFLSLQAKDLAFWALLGGLDRLYLQLYFLFDTYCLFYDAVSMSGFIAPHGSVSSKKQIQGECGKKWARITSS